MGERKFVVSLVLPQKSCPQNVPGYCNVTNEIYRKTTTAHGRALLTTLLNFPSLPPVRRFRTFDGACVVRIGENTVMFRAYTNVVRTREIMFRFGSGSILCVRSPSTHAIVRDRLPENRSCRRRM